MNLEKSRNAAIIWEPHYNTECFRPSVSKSQGSDWNYIVVVASSLRGVYRYPSKNIEHYSIIMNNKRPVYEVPIKDCEFIQKLEDMKLENKRIVVKYQLDFCKKYRKKEQDWVLKVE